MVRDGLRVWVSLGVPVLLGKGVAVAEAVVLDWGVPVGVGVVKGPGSENVTGV